MPSPPSSISVHIWLLGSWRVTQDGKPVAVPAGQPRALLTFLLLQPGGSAPRTVIAEQLWPDTAPERARRYLTDALYRLRRSLHPALLYADAEQIALDLAQSWWVDAWEFARAIDSANETARAGGLALYAGELANEIADGWILPYRARLQIQFIQALLAEATTALQHADLAGAEMYFRRLLQDDPLHEGAHRGLMQSLARRGRLASALEQYDQLVELLEQELAVPPSAATRELADQLFQELDLARRRLQKPVRPLMVGRVEERTALRTLLERASRGEPGIVVILGEPGIGKTTLLGDLAHAAGWRGWQICWGEAHAELPSAPYAPLTAALDKALPAARADQLVAGLPAVWLYLLARLFPTVEQAIRRAAEPKTHLPTAALDASSMPQAIAQLLHTLQAIAPLLLLLDDVQWGDVGLWGLLDRLLPLIRQARILIVLSARRDELRSNPAIWEHLTEWDRTGVGQIFALEGLPPSDLGELAILRSASAHDREPLDLSSASGGNPLLALEILAAGSPSATLASHPGIAALLQQRLHQLTPQARQAAELAAILGSQVDYRQWDALWQHENPYWGDLAPHAAALEQAGVLRINGDCYAFAHELLHSAALAGMAAPNRRRHHAAALSIVTAALAATPDEEAGVAPADLLRLLHHAQEAGAARATIRFALRAGQQAAQAFSFATAEAHFSQALDQLATLDGDAAGQMVENEYAALSARIEVRHLLADRAGEEADLAAIRHLPLTDEQAVAVGMCLARFQLVTGELGAAQTTVLAALQHALRLELPMAADLAIMAGKIARERNELVQAHAYIAAAQEHFQKAGNQWGVALATDLLGGIAWDQGDYNEAANRHAQAVDVFAAMGDLVHEAQSLNNLGSTLWELGRYLDARAIHERSILVCRELGSKLSEGDNVDNLGGAAWVLGDYTLALHHYQAALRLREAIDDQWGVSISLGNLGSTYQMLGDHAQALDYYARSLALSVQVRRKRSEAYIVHCQGQTRLAMGQFDEAWELLQQAYTLRNAIGDRLRLIETHSLLVKAAVARGDLESARREGATVLELLRPTDRAHLRQEAYYALFCLADHLHEPDAGRWLALAIQAQRELADVLPAADRMRFLQNVPLNQATTTAAARYIRTEEVTLSGTAGAVTFPWTLEHPEDSLIHDAAERRRQVLARLLREAAGHDAVPTHDQLAAALGVSRRTILRDLPHLTASTLPGAAEPSAE